MAGVRAQEAGLNTPEDVLQRAQEMAICELLAQPQVRRAVRQTFMERALISTREPRSTPACGSAGVGCLSSILWLIVRGLLIHSLKSGCLCPQSCTSHHAGYIKYDTFRLEQMHVQSRRQRESSCWTPSTCTAA